MRFSAAAAVLALPLLVPAAQDDFFGPYKAQPQQFMHKLASYLPNPGISNPAAVLEAKLGAMRMHVLTLEDWKETLYQPVKPGTTEPVEWWVLITGRNKTCFGHCGTVERAFNETAAKIALLSTSPRVGYLNCDDQPILCNAWTASTGSLWSFKMLPPPAPIEVYKKRLNLTTTTSSDLIELQLEGNMDSWTLVDSWFHPFHGKATQLGLSVPYGYLMWAFGLVPNWLFMLIVSFASRSMM